MKTLVKLILTLSLVPATSWANLTICKLEESSIGIKAISWDDNTGAAKVTDLLNNSYAGTVTLTRKHNDGKKVNIYIQYDKPYYGDDAAEYIVFPAGLNGFRVISVSYIVKEKKKYLNTSQGNYSATCLSM
ncbi:MAG: hypothetical protein ACC651_11925 [Candidatus Scalindua sp.]